MAGRARLWRWVASLGLLAIAACATTRYPRPPYSVEAGWHRAVVTRLGDALPALGHAMRDCRLEAGAASPPEGRYVEVRYRSAGRPMHRIALSAQGQMWAVGDRVRVNILQCRWPLVPEPAMER